MNGMNKKPPSRFSLFLAELRRRHVWRAAIAYAAVAFVLLQTGEIVLPAFDAPGWAMRLLIVLVLLGFPIALAAAWVYELTPQGIRRERTDAYDARVSLVARVVLLGVTLLIVLLVGWWTIRWTVPVEEEVTAGSGGEERGAAMPVRGEAGAIHSLAVLPFENYSQEGQADWFSAGMHEALVAQLSQIPSLRVVSRTSVMRYAGTIKTVPQIGRELRVDAIVEGSVLRADDRVRITVQLVHAATDRHIWSNSYERDLADVIELQAEVARAIADEIEAEISPEVETRLASAAPADPEALTEYMKGRHEQSKGTPEALRTAVQHYEQALDEDSAYAPALAGLASAQLLLGLQSPDSAPSLTSSAMSAASRAVNLDPNSPEARDVLIEVQREMAVLGDSLRVHVLTHLPDSLVGRGIARRVDSALAIAMDSPGRLRFEAPRFEFVEPTSELAYQIQLQRLKSARRGELGEAIPLQRMTLLGLKLGLSGQALEADRVLRSLLERDSTVTEAWDALEYLRAVRGDFAGALEVRRERAETLDGEGAASRVAALERAFRERGPRGYYEWHLERLREREAAGGEVSQLRLAQVLMELGRHDEALEHLERAVKRGESGVPLLTIDPTWDPVRGRPEFQRLVSSIQRPSPPAPPAPLRR
jgi:TolB-like protein/uncharacterized membrane protein YidH (DUF202 family)